MHATMTRCYLPLTLALALWLIPALLFAQGIPADLTAEKVLAPPKQQGWDLGLSLGTNGSFLQNENIPGQPNGITVQLGLIVDAKAALTWGQHRWSNTLVLQEGQTYTPQIAGFVRSSDNLELISTYEYGLASLPWLGPYVRAAMRTQVLRGEDVRTDDVTIIRRRTDGTVVTQQKAAGERYLLTHPFEPTILRQSAGAFARLLKSDLITVETRAGVGFQEQLAQGGFVLADDATTPELEYDQLVDTVQGGAELGAVASGKVNELVTWSVSARLFYPFFVTSNPNNLTGADLLDADFGGKLSVKLVKWLSVDYVATIRRQPLLVEGWQIQNQVLLTAAFDIVYPKPKPPEPEKCECPPPAPAEPELEPEQEPNPESETEPEAEPGPEPEPSPEAAEG